MDFLLGIGGRLKTLGARLSATWAAKLDTLATNWTATRAAKVDNLDAAITSRLASADARLAALDATISSRLATAINSIQQTVVTIANGQSEGTATITAVVTGKSIVIPRGANSRTVLDMQGIMDGLSWYPGLTNSTTVTVTRSDTTGTRSFYVTVVEYK